MMMMTMKIMMMMVMIMIMIGFFLHFRDYDEMILTLHRWEAKMEREGHLWGHGP